MKLGLVLIFSFFLSGTVFGQTASVRSSTRSSKSHLYAPRQTIKITGHLKDNKAYELKTDELEKMLPAMSVTILDLYNVNRLTTFYGPSLKAVSDKFAIEDYSKVKVRTIDGYVVEIPKKDIDKGTLCLALRDDVGYLSVDRMGPIRIISQFEGEFHKKEDALFSIYWVWQLIGLEYIK